MSSKKVNVYRDFATDVYQSLLTGGTVSHVGIFDPALWTVVPPLTFSLVQLSPSAPSLCELEDCIQVYSL